jgi:aminopeptidase N
MFFRMLRMELEDEVFLKELQDFYRKNTFRVAAFDDLRSSFEGVSGKDMKNEFNQWITRRGAPEVEVRGAGAGQCCQRTMAGA